MPTLYVAHSKSLQKWGWDVGLSKHLYKVGVTDDAANAIALALNENRHAGSADWKLLAHKAVEDSDEADILARVARKETAVDPAYYPRIKTASGVFKVKVENVEHALLVEKALANQELTSVKVTAKAIANYLMHAAIG